MRQRLVLGLVLINVLLASALLVRPAITQIIPLGLFDCCKDGGISGKPYCCESCCWLITNCHGDEDCQP